jgi:hypothetical protein
MNERYIRWWTPYLSRDFEMLASIDGAITGIGGRFCVLTKFCKIELGVDGTLRLSKGSHPAGHVRPAAVRTRL